MSKGKGKNKPVSVAFDDGFRTEDIRMRVTGMEFIKASELLDNEGNWRTHPGIQRDALRGLLKEVGITGGLLAYYSERNSGALTLVDGHLRRSTDPSMVWPVLLTDLTDEEADKVLLSSDAIGAQAKANAEAVDALLEQVTIDDLALRETLRQLQKDAHLETDGEEIDEEDDEEQGLGGPPEMEKQPFEHHDYMMLVFDDQLSFERALTFFGVRKEGYTVRTNKNWEITSKTKRKVGLGRMINGEKAMQRIYDFQHSNGAGGGAEAAAGVEGSN